MPKITRRTLGVLAVVSLLSACGRGPVGDGSLPTTATTVVDATTVVASPAVVEPTTVADPVTVTEPAIAPHPDLRTVRVGPVTVDILATWDDFVSARGPDLQAAFGPRIYDVKGYALGRLNVVSFSGTIDDLAPQRCAYTATGGGEKPTSVYLEQTAIAPVGDRKANFGAWIAECPAGPEMHRAWVLPVSHLLFWEACFDNDIGGIVGSATVTDPVPAYADVSPPPNVVPPLCSGTTDSATGT